MENDKNIIGNNLDEIRDLLDIKQSSKPNQTIEYGWFVGCTGNDEVGHWKDFSNEYISKGIWVNGYTDKLLDQVKSIKVGDRIAIKSLFNMKHNLPFNSNGKKVVCMRIKAIGIVTENSGDGRNLKVDWKKLEPAKDWYGPGSLWKTLHLVKAAEGSIKKSLLDFTFGDVKQDYSICEDYYKTDESIDAPDDHISEEEYSIDKLAELLKQMSSKNEIVLSIHLFGIRYGKYIRSKAYNIKEIISKSGLPDSYFAELNKGIKLSSYVKEIDEVPDDIQIDETSDLSVDYDSVERVKCGDNIIYYGTPGCGKSFLVDDKYTSDGYVIFRTVFHPEYSNTDFVGQLIPRVSKEDKSKITYEFKEGIFTQALHYAYYNPSVKVALVIEEINRGNASAIFGEIFQLLDRDDNGKSHYYIHNENISTHLNKPENYNLYIPSNLSLIGTMNTSDQNVYTLDTAFKRRWSMFKVKNTFEEMDLDVEKKNAKLDYLRELSSMYIPGSSYTWREFVTKINEKISTKTSTLTAHSDDKEIGLYFVSKRYLEANKNTHNSISKRLFAEKVLMYIWNDVAKTSLNKWFDDKTLDKVLENFENSTSETLLVFNNDLFPLIVLPESESQD